MLNSVAIMGRFVKTPELHKTGDNVSVTSFTLANDVYGKEDANFIECVAWRSTAEVICRHFTKGQLIAVQGKLQTREFENRNGDKRKSTEVFVNDITFCEKKEQKAEPIHMAIAREIDNEEDLPY